MKTIFFKPVLLLISIFCFIETYAQRYEYVILGEPQNTRQTTTYNSNLNMYDYIGTYYGHMNGKLKEGDEDEENYSQKVKVILKKLSQTGKLILILPELEEEEETNMLTATVQGGRLIFNDKKIGEGGVRKVRGSGYLNGDQLKFSITVSGYSEDGSEVTSYLVELIFTGEKF